MTRPLVNRKQHPPQQARRRHTDPGAQHSTTPRQGTDRTGIQTYARLLRPIARAHDPHAKHMCCPDVPGRPPALTHQAERERTPCGLQTLLTSPRAHVRSWRKRQTGSWADFAHLAQHARAVAAPPRPASNQPTTEGSAV